MTGLTERFQKARIIYRKDHTEDLWSIRVRPEHPIAFKPGQFATLGVEEGGKVVERSYSICSSPHEAEMEFFFELVMRGRVTPPLYHRQVGDTLLIRHHARGTFIFDGRSGRKQHLLVCTVTGVAPYVSMARAMAREARLGRQHNSRVVVLQAASRSWEFSYRDELEALAREFTWFTYLPVVSRPWEDSEWKGEVGRVEDVLRKYVDELSLLPENTTVYLCGHPQMIENGKGILRRRGFAKESIRGEVYWTPQKEAN
ncbi:MAG TPA: ferredoxin--NADP reductase [Terriglobia bacterium]|nr:ferredoxin--NADP reductase [Terriglobia bacterium]